MEVPPGRVERISDGGLEAIRAILAELRAMKFNGLLKTSVFRGDTPSQGVLVLRGGDGVLAEHRSQVDLAGPHAIPEILKDAASDRAQLEVRTYDYGHSAISIDQLQRSYPEAAVKGLGDSDQLLSKVMVQEAAEREAYLRGLATQREEERTLGDREDRLSRRKWELEQEYQRSGMQQKELESLRTELQAVKQASTILMQRLEERRASEDVEIQSQRKLLGLELEKARAEQDAQRRALADRVGRAADVERDLAARETLLSEREASFAPREESLERERRQMNDLYGSLQAEAEKVAEARKAFDDRLADAEHRERELILREQASREWEDRLRKHDASVLQREAATGEQEKVAKKRLKDFEIEDAKIRSRAADLTKREEALEGQEGEMEDRQAELTRATKQMEKAAKDLTTKDRKVGADEREFRDSQADLSRLQKELAVRAKELDRREQSIAQTVEELSQSRATLKEQAVKLLRSEQSLQQRMRAAEAEERELGTREATLKKREVEVEKREKATDTIEARLTERVDTAEVSGEDLRARKAALEQEHAAKRAELERRSRDLSAREKAAAATSESLESLKSSLEEQETKLIADLQELKPRKVEVEKAEIEIAREKEKLEKRSAALANQEAKVKRAIGEKESAREAREREIEAAEAVLRDREEEIRKRNDEAEKRAAEVTQRAGQTDAERKRREEAIAAQRKAIQERAARLESMKTELAVDRAATQRAMAEHKAREEKLKEREAAAAKTDTDLERRKKQLTRIKEGLKKIG